MTSALPDSTSHQITIAANIERVWDLMTQPAHLAEWYAFDGAEVDLRPGGRLVFRWNAHGAFRGRVERVERPHRFSFRFAGHVPDQDPDIGNSTLVEFTLLESQGGTIVRVVETGFASLVEPTEGGVAKSIISLEGWRGGLAALAAYAVKG